MSLYALCRICGWLGNLNRDGTLYQPPQELDPEDRSSRVQHHGPQRNVEHRSRHYRDGCRAHDHCQNCPFPQCIASDKAQMQQVVSAHHRLRWFGGKPLAEINAVSASVLAAQEGVGERTVFRRLQKLREAHS